MTTDVGNAQLPSASPTTHSLLDALRRRVARQPRRVWATLAACVALTLLFGALSFSAIKTKSATYDEPLHVVGGFMHRFFNDYRINPEDPALFGLWASIPHGGTSLLVDLNAPSYKVAPADIRQQWGFVISTLFQTPINDGDAALNASRAMFVLLGMGLCALVAWWGWKLAGAIGAIAPTTLLALDPNFLAHSGLVKNDVPLALLMLGVGYVIWQLGRCDQGRGSWWRLPVLALLVGAAVNVKFSGVLLGPIVALLLLTRALLPAELGGGPWRLAGLKLDTTAKRVVAVPVICLGIALVTWCTTWAVYGFRFAATSDGGTLNTDMMTSLARYNEVRSSLEARGESRLPTDKEFEAHAEPGAIARTILWAEKNKLLPQAWLFGFIYTYATTLIRSSYLLGQSRVVGWWYYFPAAMLFKTPLATLLAMFVALVIGLGQFIFPPLRRRLSAADDADDSRFAGLNGWSIACLLIPPAVYGLAALTTNLNLGLRHILPVYPYIYLAIGVVAAKLARLAPKPMKIVGAITAVLLAAETLGTYPNYLAFFNWPSRAPHGQANTRLGDSNLDWGQNLKELAKWQKDHKDRPMYLVYFGTVDWKFYGINAYNVNPRYPFRPLDGYNPNVPYQTLRVLPPNVPGYLVISATELQGVYSGDEFKVVREKAEPAAVMGGGTIFIYDWPLTAK
jgi:hypothetical protein